MSLALVFVFETVLIPLYLKSFGFVLFLGKKIVFLVRLLRQNPNVFVAYSVKQRLSFPEASACLLFSSC